MRKYLWEILVPAEGLVTPRNIPIVAPGIEISVSYHQQWDMKVLHIAGGLTIMRTAKGGWISQHDVADYTYRENMIPVRIMCTKKQIKEIADMTAYHYLQKAVMYYKITSHVVIREYYS